MKELLKSIPLFYYLYHYFTAYRDCFLSKKSYSQYGEDTFILNLFNSLNLSDGIYIDVGGNHPTVLSNTFLLYKNGFKGIVFEPNAFFCNLFRRIRKRDYVLQVGGFNMPKILEYKHTKYHGLNTFDPSMNVDVIRKELIPLFPVDLVMRDLEINKNVLLLSIDVEGLDFEVLEGCKNTLIKTYLVCIESNDSNSASHITDFLIASKFELIKKSHCNLIFKNSLLFN